MAGVPTGVTGGGVRSIRETSGCWQNATEGTTTNNKAANGSFMGGHPEQGADIAGFDIGLGIFPIRGPVAA